MRVPRALAPVFLATVALSSVAAAQQPPKAQLPWWDRAEERKVGHYWIKTDLPPEDANALAGHLNVMYAEYSRRLAALPPRVPEKLNVLIFAKQRDYETVLTHRFGVDPTGTGGLFFVQANGRGGLAFWTESLPLRRIHHVMQHEGFHQFAYSRFGGDLPIWVNEGLAEFFGEAIVVGRELVLGQSKPRVVNAVKDAIEDGTYIPFRQMLNTTSRQWGVALRQGRARLQYNQAWSMVHFLVYGDDGRYREAFEAYLRMLNQGMLSEDAFPRAFGPDIEQFEQRWKQVASAVRPSALGTAMERAEYLAEGALELSRRGIVPGSLEELKTQLREIQFVHRLARHGLDVELRYDDPQMFDIPQDDLAKEPPVFVVEPPDLAGLPLRIRNLEQTHRTPCSIMTEGLEPRDLRVRWRRDGETHEFSYDIVVR